MKELLKTIVSALQEDVVYAGNQLIKTASGGAYFLKSGSVSDKYRCEANGLNELSLSKAIQVAKVAAFGENYILTEYIRREKTSDDFFVRFGRELACMHRFQSD